MITEIKNNIRKDTVIIDMSVGNICNYQCWYCFKGAHEGNYKWYNYELLIKNTNHLLKWYIKNGKTRFDIHFVGGEPTHWPYLLDYIKYLKKNYNCLISMTSNGSKKLSLWNELGNYFDKVHLSYHYSQSNLQKFTSVADLLYSKGVIVSVNAMMDPIKWDNCINAVEQMKKSNYRWSIRYCEILSDVPYTEEQRKVLQKHKARNSNYFWFLFNNKYKRLSVKVNNKRVLENYLLVNKLNNFKGWHCNLGIDWVHIGPDGYIGGTCGEFVYNEKEKYNFRSTDFVDVFDPKFSSVICTKDSCNCIPETNITKCLK
jgi:MoaA/NifB/PqqE/SkfB family radical SAM enzyme